MVIIAVLSLLLNACSPVTMVRPIEAKHWVAQASFGGPVVGFSGAAIPVPFTSVGAAYGLNEVSTVSARWHTTSALFGVAHVDIGYLRQWRAQHGLIPGLSIMGQGSFMLDKWERNFSFYPELDLNAWWNLRNKPHYVYTGLTNWYELRATGTGDRRQSPRYIPAWNLGFALEKSKWTTRFELKYLAPFSSHESLTVDYIAPGTKGAIGFYVGLTRKF